MTRKFDKERKALTENNELLNTTNDDNGQLQQAIKTLETDIALITKKLEEAEALIGKLTKVCLALMDDFQPIVILFYCFIVLLFASSFFC